MYIMLKKYGGGGGEGWPMRKKIKMKITDEKMGKEKGRKLISNVRG